MIDFLPEQGHAQGNGVTTLVPSYPPNTTDQILLAFLNLFNTQDGNDLVITPPTGWTVVISATGPSMGAVYQRAGGSHSGTMTWSFNKTIRGNVEILTAINIDDSSTVNDQDLTEEFSVSSNHIAPASTTTVDNCAVIRYYSSRDTGIGYTAPINENILVNLEGTTGSQQRPTLICWSTQGAAGSTGTATATSYSIPSGHPGGSLSDCITLALKPSRAPSVPDLAQPPASITIGAQVELTWIPSTSSVSAQSTLQYEIQKSLDGGLNWTDIEDFTTAGVTSFTWNTSGLSATTAAKVRLRAFDPAISKYSLDYDVSANFSLVTETAPSPPTALTPSSGVQNKSSNVTMGWLHSGGVGNPQTEFTLQWSRDAFASHTTTVGPTTTGTQSTSIDLSAEAQGATISWKVKTQGVTLESAYSSVASFSVATAPATPNITAPTAGSPPTIPQPNIVYTEASEFIAYAFRVVLSGTTVFNPGYVTSTALSFESPYILSNGLAYTIFLKVKNQYGLESTEDSETFTPAYSGPATPTMTLTTG